MVPTVQDTQNQASAQLYHLEGCLFQEQTISHVERNKCPLFSSPLPSSVLLSLPILFIPFSLLSFSLPLLTPPFFGTEGNNGQSSSVLQASPVLLASSNPCFSLPNIWDH